MGQKKSKEILIESALEKVERKKLRALLYARFKRAVNKHEIRAEIVQDAMTDYLSDHGPTPVNVLVNEITLFTKKELGLKFRINSGFLLGTICRKNSGIDLEHKGNGGGHPIARLARIRPVKKK